MFEIKTIGDEVLKQKAKRLLKKDIPKRKKLINDLTEIMRENIGVGIAAPQVGVLEQIVVIEIKENPTYPNNKPLPLTVMINPKLTLVSKEKVDGYEGCISVPEIRGVVPRYKEISVEYLDEEGIKQRRVFEGFQARVVQHEVDHLKGIVYVEKVKAKTFITFENYKKYILKKSE